MLHPSILASNFSYRIVCQAFLCSAEFDKMTVVLTTRRGATLALIRTDRQLEGRNGCSGISGGDYETLRDGDETSRPVSPEHQKMKQRFVVGLQLLR